MIDEKITDKKGSQATREEPVVPGPKPRHSLQDQHAWIR